MKSIRYLALSAVLFSTAALAVDNATLITPCATGCVTMRSRDIGAGVQSMIQIIGDTAGNVIYGTAGTSNTNVISVQGIAGGTSLPVTANAGTNLNTSALALDATVTTTNTDIGPPGATACATDTGSCSLNALAQRHNQRLTTINTTLGTPFQAGGSIGNTTFAATQAVAASLNATVVGTGTFATQASQSGTWTVQPGNTANTTAWLVTGSGGTFPVTATNLSTNINQINGVTPLMGNGVTGTGSQRVTIASDNTAFSVNATLSAETTKVIGTINIAAAQSVVATQATAANLNATVVGTGTFATQATATQAGNWTVRNVGNAGAILDFAGQNAASPANSFLIGGQFNTTPTTLTTGNASPLQLDNAGNLKVNIAAGAGSGGTSSTFGAAFPATGTAVGMTQGGNMVALSGTSGNLNVQCANCSGSGVSTVDAAAFTASTSIFAGSGGFFQTTATANALTTGQQGMFQVTANRALFTNLRNAAGTEVGTAGAALRIDPTGATTQPVSLTSTTITGTVASTQSGTWTVQPGNTANTTAWLVTGAGGTFPVTATNLSTNISQINAVTPLMGNGVTGTGSQRVTIASDNTAFAVNATLSAETTKVIGTTRTLGNAGAITDFAGQNATSPANSWLIGGQFNTTPTTLTTGNSSPLQLDNAGNLKVNIIAGAGSGGTASTFGAAFPATGTAVGFTDGTNMVAGRVGAAANVAAATGMVQALGVAQYNATPLTVTDTRYQSLQSDVNGFLKVNVTNANANGQATMANSSPVVIASNQSAVSVTCTNCSGSGASAVDEAAFTAGTSVFAGGGGFFQTTATANALTNGQQGMWQMTANRAGFVNLRNAAGTEVGTAAAPVRTDPTGTTTQPVSLTSTTITGTVAATQSGTWTVQPGNTANTTAWLVTGAGGTFPVTATNLSTNVAQINGVTPLMGQGATGAGSHRVTIANDNTLPTGWASSVGIASTTAGQTGPLAQCAVTTAAPTYTNAQTDPLSCDTAGALRVNTGTVAVTATNLSTNVAQINGVTPLMGNGVTGTGSQRVTIASDNTAFAVNATLSAETTKVIGTVNVAAAQTIAVTNAGTFAVTQGTAASLNATVVGTGTFAVQAASTLAAETTKVIGTVRNLGNAGAILDFAGQNATSPANSFLMGGQFNTTPTTITSGNASPLQLDNAGNLLVNIKAGASSGAVAQGSTTAGQTGTLIQGAVTTAAPTYTTAQTSPISLDTSGNVRVSATGIAIASTTAGQTGSLVMCGVTTAAPTYTTAQSDPLSCDTAGSLRTSLAAETTKVIGTVRSVGNAGAVFDAATGAAPPANVLAIGANTSGATGGLMAGLIQCDSTAIYDASTSGSTELVALTTGRTIYVCGYTIMASGTVNAKLIYGTGTACATGATNMTPAWQLTAQVGLVDGAAFSRGLKTASANALCINTSAGISTQAIVYYAKL